MYMEWGEYVKMLKPDEQAQLFCAIFDYHKDGKVPEFKGEAKMLFEFMTNQFKRDREKWEDTRKKRSESGKKGAEARRGNLQGPDVVREKLNMEEMQY